MTRRAHEDAPEPTLEETREEIARTREALARGLAEFKDQLLGTPRASTQGAKKRMATRTTGKKAASSRANGTKAAAQKTTPKKSAPARAAAKHAAPKSHAKRSLGTKAKKVLGKALEGAAVGAVEGALEAVLPAQPNQKVPSRRRS